MASPRAALRPAVFLPHAGDHIRHRRRIVVAAYAHAPTPAAYQRGERPYIIKKILLYLPHSSFVHLESLNAKGDARTLEHC